MRFILSRHLVAGFLIAAGALSAVGAEPDSWHQFRGPGARGISENVSLPLKWSATENVEWQTEIGGRGWSSPVVADGKIVLTTVINSGQSEEPKKGLYFGGDRPTPPTAEHEWRVVCLDLETGKPLWSQTVAKSRPESAIHIKNSFASETPVTDGVRVYCYFGNKGIYCLDLAGNVVWEKPLKAHKTRFGWGTAASPILEGDRLYLVNDNEEDSYLLALDKKTGDEVWQIGRDEKSNWATPYLWKHDGRSEIVTPGTGQTRSYDLDGKLLWSLRGMSSITIATPYQHNDLLYVSSGYVLDKSKPLYAIRPGAKGDISLQKGETSSEWIAWCQPQAAPYNPSTLVYKDRLFVLYDRGFCACFDPATGSPVYDKARIPKGRAFTASPWACRDKIFCLNEDGVTFVIDASDEFKIAHTNSLREDDMCMATPALVGDRLLIRTAERIYCIRESN